MNFRIAGLVALLTVLFVQNASAQVPPDCGLPEVLLQASTAVSPPKGYEQAEAYFYDMEEGEKEDLQLTRGRPPRLIPNAQIVRDAQAFSTETPGRYKLLWEKPGTTERCLQDFSFILPCNPAEITLQERIAAPAPKGYERALVYFYDT